jgi:hypothetical protein
LGRVRLAGRVSETGIRSARQSVDPVQRMSENLPMDLHREATSSSQLTTRAFASRQGQQDEPARSNIRCGMREPTTVTQIRLSERRCENVKYGAH